MAEIALMRYMSWTYEAYMKTPCYMIDLIFMKMRVDAEEKTDTIPTE